VKDYYLSKINKEITDSPLGLVELFVEDNLKLHIQFSSESYGVSPIRINNVFEADHESLRAPKHKVRQSPLLFKDEKLSVPVLELLNRQESNDVKLIQAESAFNCQNFSLAYEIIKKISDEDPYFVEIVPLHCSVLIELEKQGELYFLAHKLVNANPDSAISWYAVGSYYYLIKKYP